MRFFSLLACFLFPVLSLALPCKEYIALHNRVDLSEIPINIERLSSLNFRGNVYETRVEAFPGESPVQIFNSSGKYYKEKDYTYIRLDDNSITNDYVFFQHPDSHRTWSEARNACRESGMDLPIVTVRFLLSAIPNFIWQSQDSFTDAQDNEHFFFALWARTSSEDTNEALFQDSRRAMLFSFPEEALGYFFTPAPFYLKKGYTSKEYRHISQAGVEKGILLDRVRAIGSSESAILPEKFQAYNAEFMENVHLHVADHILQYFMKEAEIEGTGEEYINALPEPTPGFRVADAFFSFLENNKNLLELKEFAADESMTIVHRRDTIRFAIDRDLNEDAYADWKEFYPEELQKYLQQTKFIYFASKTLSPIVSGEESIPTICMRKLPKYRGCETVKSRKR